MLPSEDWGTVLLETLDEYHSFFHHYFWDFELNLDKPKFRYRQNSDNNITSQSSWEITRER